LRGGGIPVSGFSPPPHPDWLKQQGVKIVYGPGRHPISTAMMVYFEGPDGMVYEYSVGVKHIMPEQEATYRPRQFSG
jgi:2,3-dihydroxy-p-cumate/2,3-dihydroxybenzoate 3,4-dioxygenase